MGASTRRVKGAAWCGLDPDFSSHPGRTGVFDPTLNLRCTRKLLGRLHVAPAADETASTTVLGDWYATILVMRPAHLILLVNERSRLPVILPAREPATLFDRIPEAIAQVLFDLGADSRVIEREMAAMATIQCTPTRNRSVVGTMNEFVFVISGASWLGSEVVNTRSRPGRPGEFWPKVVSPDRPDVPASFVGLPLLLSMLSSSTHGLRLGAG